MTTIGVFHSGYHWVPPEEFGFANADELVASLSEEFPDYSIEFRFPRVGGPTPEFFIEVARHIMIFVPWDSLRDAAAGAFVTQVFEWGIAQVRKRKQQDEDAGDPLRDRPDLLFPQGSSREEKERRVLETPYHIGIFTDQGPPQPIRISISIEIDPITEEAQVIKHPPPSRA
jgi:hypothetical protein